MEFVEIGGSNRTPVNSTTTTSTISFTGNANIINCDSVTSYVLNVNSFPSLDSLSSTTTASSSTTSTSSSSSPNSLKTHSIKVKHPSPGHVVFSRLNKSASSYQHQSDQRFCSVRRVASVCGPLLLVTGDDDSCEDGDEEEIEKDFDVKGKHSCSDVQYEHNGSYGTIEQPKNVAYYGELTLMSVQCSNFHQHESIVGDHQHQHLPLTTSTPSTCSELEHSETSFPPAMDASEQSYCLQGDHYADVNVQVEYVNLKESSGIKSKRQDCKYDWSCNKRRTQSNHEMCTNPTLMNQTDHSVKCECAPSDQHNPHCGVGYRQISVSKRRLSQSDLLHRADRNGHHHHWRCHHKQKKENILKKKNDKKKCEPINQIVCDIDHCHVSDDVGGLDGAVNKLNGDNSVPNNSISEPLGRQTNGTIKVFSVDSGNHPRKLHHHHHHHQHHSKHQNANNRTSDPRMPLKFNQNSITDNNCDLETTRSDNMGSVSSIDGVNGPIDQSTRRNSDTRTNQYTKEHSNRNGSISGVSADSEQANQSTTIVPMDYCCPEIGPTKGET